MKRAFPRYCLFAACIVALGVASCGGPDRHNAAGPVDASNDGPTAAEQTNVVAEQDFVLTPRRLFLAVNTGDLQLMESLIADGVDLNRVGKMGIVTYTALMKAVELDDEDMVTLLLDNGAEIDKTVPLGNPASTAARYGHFRLLQKLVERGADLNLNYDRYMETSRSGGDQFYRTPVWWAASRLSPPRCMTERSMGLDEARSAYTESVALG